jgi:hypothetical protein
LYAIGRIAYIREILELLREHAPELYERPTSHDDPVIIRFCSPDCAQGRVVSEMWSTLDDLDVTITTDGTGRLYQFEVA